jgi:hypothetical protein
VIRRLLGKGARVASTGSARTVQTTLCGKKLPFTLSLSKGWRAGG